MVRSRGLTCVALIAFAVGVGALLQPREPLGRVMDGGSVYENRMANLGRGMFAISWPAEDGKPFNDNACMGCHNAPTIGGEARSSLDNPFFAPDPSAISGTSNLRRLVRSNGEFTQLFHNRDDKVRRRSQPLYGVGLLDAIPTATLQALEDPTDKNGDGISGRLPRLKNGFGRFGWKSDHVNLAEFVKDAFKIELGTEPHDPKTNPTSQLDSHQLDATVRYLRLLAAPSPAPDIAEMPKGRALFDKIQCGACHVPTVKTGPHPLAALANKTIHPYSDMLLHHMGDGNPHLAPAKPALREVRTPPLWGLGKMRGPFLHDASARTVEDAILGHRGEGQPSADAYRALNDEDKATLLAWLAKL